MKKLLDIINRFIIKLKKDSYIRLIVELMIGVLLFNINTIFSILFLIIIALEVLFASVENSLYVYLFLSFFDEVIQIKFLGGSVTRIIMIIIALKLIFNILKKKLIPSKTELGISIFLVFSVIVGFITYKTISIDVLIVWFNIFIFVLFSMNIKIKGKKQLESFLEKLLIIIVVAVLGSIIYGFLSNSFLKEIDAGDIVYRFKGTYEPNFMCMYINLGILALLALKSKIPNKILHSFLVSIMVVANIMTVSVTGLATLIIMLILYLFFKRKNIKDEIRSFLYILFISLILFGGIKLIGLINSESSQINIENSTIKENVEKENEDKDDQESLKENEDDKKENAKEEISNNNLKKRFSFLLDVLKDGNLDRFTSGRLPLIGTFIKASFNRPLFNILFGNDLNTKKLFSNYFYAEKYSHNSYMDILYNFGIVGFTLIGIFILKKLFKNKFLEMDLNKTKYKYDIKLIRIMLLIYALSLSMYTKRMFLIFFLL